MARKAAPAEAGRAAAPSRAKAAPAARRAKPAAKAAPAGRAKASAGRRAKAAPPNRAKAAPARKAASSSARAKPAAKAPVGRRAKPAPTSRAKVTARSATTRRPAGRPDGSAGRRALGRVDGGRGQRDGAAVRKGQARAQRRRRVVGAVVATVMAVGVMYVALFPGQTLWTQRASTAKAEAELRDVQAQRAVVARQADLLDSDAEIEKRAREDFGMKREGQEIVNILPTQTEPIGLPDGWPFTGVERAFGAP